MYQRTYHDVSAIDFDLDGSDDFTFNMEVDTRGTIDYIFSIDPTSGQIVQEKISEIWTRGGVSAGIYNRNIRWIGRIRASRPSLGSI